MGGAGHDSHHAIPSSGGCRVCKSPGSSTGYSVTCGRLRKTAESFLRGVVGAGLEEVTSRLPVFPTGLESVTWPLLTAQEAGMFGLVGWRGGKRPNLEVVYITSNQLVLEFRQMVPPNLQESGRCSLVQGSEGKGRHCTVQTYQP